MNNAIIYVPLNKLEIDPLNVRRTYSQESIKEFAASIEAKGILQNILGRRASGNGRYYVSAGGRRYRAAMLLVEAGKIAVDHPVALKEITKEDAIELSLAENIMREGMNPADQFEAFRDLIDNGKSVSDIAVRFGTSETIVKKRLALGRVAPELRELFRQEKMNLEQLSAFTICDDHAEQIRVWNALPSYSRSSHYIKQELAGDGIRGSDKRIRFIGGLETYEEAGGAVKRDLFDDQSGSYAIDTALVERLVAEKFQAEAEAIAAEGWKWVETMLEIDWQALQEHGRVYPQKPNLTEEQNAELDRMAEEYDALAALIEADDAAENAEAELDALQVKMKALEAEFYTADDMAMSGVVIGLNHLGDVRIERGLVKPEDTKREPEEDTDKIEDHTPTLKHSAILTEDLTAQKTTALRLELVNNPDVALAAVVHAMLLRVGFQSFEGDHSTLEISLTQTPMAASMKNPEDNLALEELETLSGQFKSRLPKNPADLWDWCLSQDCSDLLALLAFAAAQTVNAVEGRLVRSNQARHANQLGQALGFNMGKYFEPTAKSYFGHLNRPSIEAAVVEARGQDFAAGIAAMKKTEGAIYAEQQVRNSGWLPEPLRFGVELAVEEADIAEDCEAFPQAVE
jgi:ParB family transcriptional regulator, chromosome partitioning protein